MFPLACIFFAIIIVGFIGNVLIIFIIGVNRKLHDRLVSLNNYI